MSLHKHAQRQQKGMYNRGYGDHVERMKERMKELRGEPTSALCAQNATSERVYVIGSESTACELRVYPKLLSK